MLRPPRIAIAAVVIVVAVPFAIGAAGDTVRQTLTYAGLQAGAAAEGGAISPDGTHLVFTSPWPLTGVATGGRRQLFMRDLTSGRITLVSSNATGQPAADDVDEDTTGASGVPYGVSLDGRYVTFASVASNLVPGDTNGAARDVFRKDTRTGRVVVVSRGSAGLQPDAGVRGEPSISADGMRVAFTSGAGALTTSDSTTAYDVYLADLLTGTITLVSRSSTGEQSPEDTRRPSISADGRAVAFEGTAAASVLTSDDTDSAPDVYVARPADRTVTVASVPTGGTDGAASLPSLSGDGSMVAFASSAALVITDVDGTTDAYVRDLRTHTTQRVSGAAITGRPALSANRGRVAFSTVDAPDPLVDTNGSGVHDVYVRTLSSGVLTLVSHRPNGTSASEPSGRPAISATGGIVSFTYVDNGTGSQSPVLGDTNSRADVYSGDMGALSPTTPQVTALVTYSGPTVTISGRVTDDAGIATLMVAGYTARVADDGAYAVTMTTGTGTRTLVVEARSGAGVRGRTSVTISGSAVARVTPGAVPRPTGLRVVSLRPWVQAWFRLPVPATWRVELRLRVPGATRVAAFRILASTTGRVRVGQSTARVRVPATVRPGTYQVRVLMSSALGLGTSSRTLVIN